MDSYEETSRVVGHLVCVPGNDGDYNVFAVQNSPDSVDSVLAVSLPLSDFKCSSDGTHDNSCNSQCDLSTAEKKRALALRILQILKDDTVKTDKTANGQHGELRAAQNVVVAKAAPSTATPHTCSLRPGGCIDCPIQRPEFNKNKYDKGRTAMGHAAKVRTSAKITDASSNTNVGVRTGPSHVDSQHKPVAEDDAAPRPAIDHDESAQSTDILVPEPAVARTAEEIMRDWPFEECVWGGQPIIKESAPDDQTVDAVRGTAAIEMQTKPDTVGASLFGPSKRPSTDAHESSEGADATVESASTLPSTTLEIVGAPLHERSDNLQGVVTRRKNDHGNYVELQLHLLEEARTRIRNGTAQGAFELFKFLPVEVRTLIWKKVLLNDPTKVVMRHNVLDRRVELNVALHPDTLSPLVFSPRSISPALHTCYESRKVALEQSDLAFGQCESLMLTRINFDHCNTVRVDTFRVGVFYRFMQTLTPYEMSKIQHLEVHLHVFIGQPLIMFFALIERFTNLKTVTLFCNSRYTLSVFAPYIEEIINNGGEENLDTGFAEVYWESENPVPVFRVVSEQTAEQQRTSVEWEPIAEAAKNMSHEEQCNNWMWNYNANYAEMDGKWAYIRDGRGHNKFCMRYGHFEAKLGLVWDGRYDFWYENDVLIDEEDLRKSEALAARRREAELRREADAIAAKASKPKPVRSAGAPKRLPSAGRPVGPPAAPPAKSTQTSGPVDRRSLFPPSKPGKFVGGRYIPAGK